MNHLKISTRLYLVIGAMSALLVIIGAIGLAGISQSNAALRSVYEDRTVPMDQLADIQHKILSNRLAIATALVTPTPEVITANTAEVEANIATIGKLWTAFMAANLTPEEARIAQKFADDRQRFVQDGLVSVVAALRANHIDDAKRLVVEKTRPLYIPVDAGMEALLKLQVDEAHHEYSAAVARYATTRWVSIGSIVIGVLIAFALGMKLIRDISRSLTHAADIADAVAQGDLTKSVHAEGRCEVAQVLKALAAMQQNLAKVVANVRSDSEGVATASAEIASGQQRPFRPHRAAGQRPGANRRLHGAAQCHRQAKRRQRAPGQSAGPEREHHGGSGR